MRPWVIGLFLLSLVGVVLILIGGTALVAIGVACMGVAAVGAVSLRFFIVGRSEDEARAEEEAARAARPRRPRQRRRAAHVAAAAAVARGHLGASRNRSAGLLRLRTFGDRCECRSPRRREDPAEKWWRRGGARAEHLGQPVMVRARRRVSQDPEEALAHREVQPDQQRGRHGCRAIRLRPRGRDGALHAVQEAPFDVLTHEGVEPELAPEMVVERTRGDARRRRQLGDRDLVERARPELLDRGERQPALRRRRNRDPVAHAGHNAVMLSANPVTHGGSRHEARVPVHPHLRPEGVARPLPRRPRLHRGVARRRRDRRAGAAGHRGAAHARRQRSRGPDRTAVRRRQRRGVPCRAPGDAHRGRWALGDPRRLPGHLPGPGRGDDLRHGPVDGPGPRRRRTQIPRPSR